MVKSAFFLVLGFGLIAAGIAGVATTMVVQKNEVAVKEIEQLQGKMWTESLEEQKKLEERRKELDRLAKDIEVEKKRLEEDRRRGDEEQRARKAALEDRERAAARLKVEPPKRVAPEGDQGGMRQQAPYKRFQDQARKGSSYAELRRSQSSRTSRSEVSAENLKGITRRASLEVARSFEPVEYYNRRIRQLVVAEPFDYSAGWMRVRVRVWRSERLVMDDLVRIPLARWYQERMAEL